MKAFPSDLLRFYTSWVSLTIIALPLIPSWCLKWESKHATEHLPWPTCLYSNQPMNEKKPWLPWVKQYQAARRDMKLYDPYTFLEVFLLFFPFIFLLPFPYLLFSRTQQQNMGILISFYFKGLFPVVKVIFANCEIFGINRSINMNKNNSHETTTQR